MQTNNDLARNNTAFAVLSAHRGHLNVAENDARTQRLRRELANHTDYYKSVCGFFEGVAEASFLVALDHGALDANDVQAIAESFDQDSLLILGAFDHIKGGRPAYLREYGSATGGEYLGTFKAVPEYFAKSQDAYTYDPAMDTYFAIV